MSHKSVAKNISIASPLKQMFRNFVGDVTTKTPIMFHALKSRYKL